MSGLETGSPDVTLDRLREFILEVFYLTDPAELTPDVSLISSGIVDSTGMLDIILFVESEYGISVLDHEARPENFETLARIAAYVRRKRDAAAA